MDSRTAIPPSHWGKAQYEQGVLDISTSVGEGRPHPYAVSYPAENRETFAHHSVLCVKQAENRNNPDPQTTLAHAV